MNKPVFEAALPANYALDTMLLGVAVGIEPSDNDERIANKRYQLLEKVLQRPKGILKQYLLDHASSIYAQGSFASGTLIVSGEKDDRFDVDAIVQFTPPINYTPKLILDVLHHDLQGFPGAIEIERCTRCIQVRFPQMHLDVTPLVPPAVLGTPSYGDICHSPDEDRDYYVPAHPKGAADWYRGQMGSSPIDFYASQLTLARSQYSVDRLSALTDAEKASVEPLPEVTSTRSDDLRVIAVKLLKRHLRKIYRELGLKRPPSIYVTILSGYLPQAQIGVADELIRLADLVKNDVITRLTTSLTNPAYAPDIITDRWPGSHKDVSVLTQVLNTFIGKLTLLKTADLKVIQATLSELFGERVATSVVKQNFQQLANSGDVGVNQDGALFDINSAPKPVLAAPYIKPKPNTFHCGKI